MQAPPRACKNTSVQPSLVCPSNCATAAASTPAPTTHSVARLGFAGPTSAWSFFPADYLGQDTSREWEMAKRLERERRPALQILVAYARSAAFPLDFQAFPIAPSATEPVQQPGFDRDRQLARVAHMARTLLSTRTRPRCRPLASR